MKKHYLSIDGLRTFACLGIIMMHIRANTNYMIEGYIYNTIIPSFTYLVFLFMVISAFGMCCGYYDKVMNNEINYVDFYNKRYKKILPFFTCLVLLDILVSPSKSSLIEGFMDLTLLFGFLPDLSNIQVIGVGWFIGMIFVFYFCFPFFCTLISNKKKAWFIFVVSLIINYCCFDYYDLNRYYFLYCFCFFISGGLIYLYRDLLERVKPEIAIVFSFLSIVIYYLFSHGFTCLLVADSLLILGICSKGKILGHKFVQFISSLSLEIYLSHMFIFRIVEKAGLTQFINIAWIQYLLVVL